MRDRDIKIAKLTGWRCEYRYGYWNLIDSQGETRNLLACTTEEAAWSEFNTAYSTDITAAAGLLVDVLLRGWKVIENVVDRGWSSITLNNGTGDEKGVSILKGSQIADPIASWCDAVSKACLAALEADA